MGRNIHVIYLIQIKLNSTISQSAIIMLMCINALYINVLVIDKYM